MSALDSDALVEDAQAVLDFPIEPRFGREEARLIDNGGPHERACAPVIARRAV